MSLLAVIWDYDGTLMDTTYKNFMVTREIMLHIKPELKKTGWPTGIATFERYKEILLSTLNWHDVYLNHFELNIEQIQIAAKLWSDFQLKNDTPVTLFEGLSKVIEDLSFVPQGICSLNCSHNITNTLQKIKLDHYFKTVVGYNVIAVNRQKPLPDAFLHCYEQMELADEGQIFYIGDHEEDMEFAKNAQIALKDMGKNITITSIAANYGNIDSSNWCSKPDYNANSVKDIYKIIKNK